MNLVRAFPRVHIGLLDLGDATHRRHGGAGFTLSGPAIEVTAEPGPDLQVVGLDGLDAQARRDVDGALARLQDLAGPAGATLTLRHSPPQHVGLGSKTALLLSLLQAMVSLSGRPIDRCALQLLTGRGGTSGVGIHSFFVGGFVADAGHPAAPGRPYGPSSASRPERVPPVVCRLEIPPDWRFTLLADRSTRIDGEAERRLFADSTPLPEREVLLAVALMYQGIVPAVATGDLGLLGTALADFHGVGFKQRELAAQSAATRALYERARRVAGTAVGLSSVGPLLYVVTSDGADAAVRTSLEHLAAAHGCALLGTFEPRNAGFQLHRDPPP